MVDWLKKIVTDPRKAISFAFFVFVLRALTYEGYARTPQQFLVPFFSCWIFDMIHSYFLTGKVKFPFSMLLSSVGLFLMLEANGVFYYFIAAYLTVAGKYFIQSKGRHIFNPNNFAIVVMLVTFYDRTSVNMTRWGGNVHFIDTWFPLVMIFLGFGVTYLANRWAVSIGYILGFLMAAPLRGLAGSGTITVTHFMPITGSSLILYMFFMITDPQTSPRGRMGQLFFGLSIAFFDNYFRYIELRQSPIFALFVVCFLRWYFLDVLQPLFMEERKLVPAYAKS